MLAAFYLLALFFDLDKNVPTTEAFMYICTYGEEKEDFYPQDLVSSLWCPNANWLNQFKYF